MSRIKKCNVIVAPLQMSPVYYLCPHACDEEFMRRRGPPYFSAPDCALRTACDSRFRMSRRLLTDSWRRAPARRYDPAGVIIKDRLSDSRIRLYSGFRSRVPLILAAFGGVSATPTRQLSCSLTSIINDLPTISCVAARSSTTATPGGTNTVSETDTSCPKTDGRLMRRVALSAGTKSLSVRRVNLGGSLSRGVISSWSRSYIAFPTVLCSNTTTTETTTITTAATTLTSAPGIHLVAWASPWLFDFSINLNTAFSSAFFLSSFSEA